MTAQRFRKKPVEVDAVQWDGTAQAAGPIMAALAGMFRHTYMTVAP